MTLEHHLEGDVSDAIRATNLWGVSAALIDVCTLGYLVDLSLRQHFYGYARSKRNLILGKRYITQTKPDILWYPLVGERKVARDQNFGHHDLRRGAV